MPSAASPRTTLSSLRRSTVSSRKVRRALVFGLTVLCLIVHWRSAMALTPSTMLLLGTKAPDFSLPDVVSGKTISLSTFAGKKALLVMFICRHCPYVQHVKEELARLGRDYAAKDIGIVAISANDAAGYPDDAPDGLAAMAKE